MTQKKKYTKKKKHLVHGIDRRHAEQRKLHANSQNLTKIYHPALHHN